MTRRKLDPIKYGKAFGSRVRELRTARHWTLEETEEHGWGDWKHLQRIESGKNITLQTVVKLANLFNMTPDELLRGV